MGLRDLGENLGMFLGVRIVSGCWIARYDFWEYFVFGWGELQICLNCLRQVRLEEEESFGTTDLHGFSLIWWLGCFVLVAIGREFLCSTLGHVLG